MIRMEVNQKQKNILLIVLLWMGWHRTINEAVVDAEDNEIKDALTEDGSSPSRPQ